jgi:preprotein translocase subunit SecG
MLLLTLNVIYVLLAVGMIVLILMQRGAGAQAGSGFGGGASATVFGARGSSNFLSKSTKWLAVAFFSISLFMAWYATHRAQPAAASQQDLGVMAQVPASPAPAPTTGGATPGSSVPSLPAQQPAAPATSVPVMPTQPPAGTAPATGQPTPPASPAPGG